MLRRLLLSLLSAASVSGAGITGCAHHPGSHHGHGSHHPGGPGASQGISVSGRGEARAAPDIARATVGIEIRAETAEQATTQANTQMSSVITALRNAGVAEADLRTNNFSITFEREHLPEPMPMEAPVRPATRTAPAAPVSPPTPRGFYRASNTVEVVVRDISKVSQILSAATTGGANNVWGVQFELSDREPLRAQARAQAVERAKQTAQQLAQLTGVKLGRIRSVEDLADGAAPIMYGGGAMRAQMAEASNVPVQQGELTLHHEVRVVYSLDED